MKTTKRKSGRNYLDRISRAAVKAESGSKEHIKENFISKLSHISNIKLLILEWGLLVVALIMLAITQALWFRDSYTNEVFSSGGTYTEATYGEVNSLNPLFAMSNSEKVLSRLMFATLATVDYSGHTNVGLAETIQADENGKVWKVKLKNNLKWSDGEPITNKDLVFTANLIKDSRTNSIYSSNLTNVTVSESEEGEVIFTLPVAYADFMSALNFPIIPEHIFNNIDPQALSVNDFYNNPVTSGPFSFNATQLTTKEDEKVFYLSANPNYYDGGPSLSSFIIHVYNTKTEIIDALNSGAVTATAELSELDQEKITSKQIQQKNSSLSSGAFIFFNTASSNVKDRALRSAIRMGIDFKKVRESAPGSLALDFPLLPSQIELNRYPEIPSYDLDTAKTKIRELLNGEQPTLEVATVNSGYLPNVTNTIANELKELGFNTNVSVYEENQEFIKNILSRRNYDILVYEVELGAEPDLLPYYHSSQATGNGLNLSSYRNALVDDLLLSARGTLDKEQRIKKYESFLEYWVTGVPAIGLYRPNLTYYYNQNARTFGNNVRLVTALDRFSDISSWAVNKSIKNKTP